ncbi:MAG: hypothetical protein H0W96_07980, partial [Solirubrobacterales bacterium]|nr:hypothetical protein [Solirubrobacterales bacterium]
MRVVGLHSDVLVATSRIWQTTCTIVRRDAGSGTGECFVIDSPILPDELEVLPAVLEHAGFGFSGLLATHADWDHLLARMAFPAAALGVAELADDAQVCNCNGVTKGDICGAVKAGCASVTAV